jgi:glyoxylate/hydroxypyruvate reductase A
MKRINIVLIATDFEFTTEWYESIKSIVPNIELYGEQDTNTESIDIALVYNPPSGKLCQYTNLKVIITLSAGVDGLLSDSLLPNVPIVRLISTEISDMMREYVVYHSLGLHRNFKKYEQFQVNKKWQWLPPSISTRYRKITVLGMGKMGYQCALALQNLGFDVSGWSRTVKDFKNIKTFSGLRSLNKLLPKTQILVCVLPLTSKTKNILSKNILYQLPKGASLINISRGTCLNEEDLLFALNDGHLSNAVLDVFESEPLPISNPLWVHPSVVVTPHIAGDVKPLSTANEILTVVNSLRENKPFLNTINVELGY